MSSPRSKTLISNPWWKAGAGAAHTDVFATLDYLREQQGGRRQEDLHHMRLYTNLDIAGRGSELGRRQGLWRGVDGRQRFNLCSSAVDTAQSLITSQKPKPMYLTTEGDFKQQRQARLRSRALEGQLDDCGMYALGPECFIDAAVNGTGTVHAYACPHTGEAKLERVMPGELFVDHAESIQRKPRTMYRCRLMSREVACALWPKHEKKLAVAASPTQKQANDWWIGRDTTADLIVIVESWHLASGPKSKDGKHTLCASNVDLVEEEYTRERFPFAHLRWKQRPFGFWGMGIVEECRDAQWRINKIIKREERVGNLVSNAMLLLDSRSKVKVSHMANEPVLVVKYDGRGNPPQIVNNNVSVPDLVQKINEIREQTFSMLGISQSTAKAEKPSGLDSGKALRAHDDINSRRHLEPSKRYEQFFMDVVELLEDLNEESYGRDGSLKITARSQRGGSTLLREVKWSEIRDPKNKLRIRAFPTSFLPSTPQGKWAAVQEIVASGFVSKPFAQSLMDFPDLDAATRTELADLDAIQCDVEDMLDGEQRTPEIYQDLVFAKELCRKSYLQARTNRAPEDTLQLMRDYIADCDELLAPPEQPPAAPPAPGPEGLPADASGLPPEGLAVVGGMNG